MARTTTEKISKKQKLIPFMVFIFFSLTALIRTTVRDRVDLGYGISSREDISSLLFGAIFFSLYAFIMPWVIERVFLPRFRNRMNQSRMSPETLTLLMSYVMLYFPVIAGNVLYGLGLPINQTYYFIGAGILGALIWCLYTLRNNATW